MPALICQLTYRDACGAAWAWIRLVAASVGLIPVSLNHWRLPFEQIHRDCGLQDHQMVSACFGHHPGTPDAGPSRDRRPARCPKPRRRQLRYAAGRSEAGSPGSDVVNGHDLTQDRVGGADLRQTLEVSGDIRILQR
jgi:hypothetical protein